MQESELRLRSAGVIPVVTDLNSPSEHLYDQRVGSRLGMLRLFIVPHKLVLTLHTVFSMRRPQVSLMKCLNTATFDGTNLQPLHASRPMATGLETPTLVQAVSTMGTEICDLASLLLVQHQENWSLL